MDTQSIKTSELAGASLRYAVAVATGYEIRYSESVRMWFVESVTNGDGKPTEICPSGCELAPFEPDRDWSQLGPIKQRFRVDTEYLEGAIACCIYTADPDTVEVIAEEEGPDELIAACRAIAASHWGEYADIPSELVEESDE